MSDVGVVSAEKEQVRSVKLSFVRLVLVIVVSVISSVAILGMAGFWLIKTGRMPAGLPVKAEASVRAEASRTKLIALDPLLVNLADESGHAYLRVGIVLREEEHLPMGGAKAEASKEEKSENKKAALNESDVTLRDVALGVIGRETAGALLASDGKERLKTVLQKTMQERAPESKLLDVLFTEFLVQR